MCVWSKRDVNGLQKGNGKKQVIWDSACYRDAYVKDESRNRHLICVSLDA